MYPLKRHQDPYPTCTKDLGEAFLQKDTMEERLHSVKPSLLQNRPLFHAICPGSIWVRDNMWFLSRVQWLVGPAGETGAFCPGWRHQPGQKSPLLSRWCLQPGQKALPPLSPSLSPRPSHSAHLFLLFLAREGGVLAHFFTTFVKIFDSFVHPSALKVWGLFFSSSLACIAHFML